MQGIGQHCSVGTRSDFCLLVLLLVFGCGPTSGDTVRFIGCDTVRFVGWIRPCLPGVNSLFCDRKLDLELHGTPDCYFLEQTFRFFRFFLVTSLFQSSDVISESVPVELLVL